MIDVADRISDIGDLVEIAGERWPERFAIVDNDVTFSYADLALHTRQISNILMPQIPIGARIGLMPERNAESLVLYIALMAAGMVPIVLPDVPESVLQRQADALDLALVVSAIPNAPRLGRIPIADWADLCVGSDARSPRGRHELATLTLTSGSMGLPKAVMVTHANLLHYSKGLLDRIGGRDKRLRFGNLTSLAADLGHTAIFPALLSGGTVQVADSQTARDPQRFWHWAERHRLDLIKSTPSQFRALLEGRRDGDWCFPMLILGGERLTHHLGRKIFEDGVTSVLVNHYGPCETTVGAACQIFRSPDDFPADGGDLSIGTPIGEAVLDLLPLGDDHGELVISGPCVTRGYYQQPELTAARFPTMQDGLRVYRTGDVFQRLPDGGLRFQSRLDRQIKVRGYAVDLHEVERIIESDPAVRLAAVFQREVDSVVHIAALIVPSDDASSTHLSVESLQLRLAMQLPAWACPTFIIQSPTIPVSDNGKIDYASAARMVEDLSAVSFAPPDLDIDDTKTSSDLTHRILDICRELLGSRFLTAHDRFGQAGLDSIHIMRLISKLRAQGVLCAVENIHRHDTATSLAAYLDRAPRDDWQIDAGSPSENKALSAIQRWFFGLGLNNPDHWNQALVLETETSIDVPSFVSALSALREYHPILCQPFDYKTGSTIVRTDVPVSELVVTRLPPSAVAREQLFRAACREGQTGIDLQSGRLMKTHLFQSGDGRDRILLIIHHLVVDGVSWRILIDDLLSAYLAVRDDKLWRRPAGLSFWDWNAELGENQLSIPASDTPQPIFRPIKTEMEYSDAIDSIVLALSEAQTSLLVEACGPPAELETMLALAVADAVGEVNAVPTVTMSVESHGRDAVPGAERFYDCLGWFTATRNATFHTGSSDTFLDRLAGARLALRGDATPADGPSCEICFNFLGSFCSPQSDGVRWHLGAYYCGPARSSADDSFYAIRFTERIVDGRLSIDLVTDPRRIDRQTADSIIIHIRERIAARVGCAAVEIGHLRRGMGSTSGLVAHAPMERVRAGTEPRPVLLTGGTGFFGAFLLDAMLRSTKYRPICLVRGSSETHARNRLLQTIEHYFGKDAARIAAERVGIYRGDLTIEGLGLHPRALQRESIDAIFHLAADTRLVTSPQADGDTNVAATRRVIDWSATNGGIDLYHVSTLAIAGTASGRRKVFDEAQYDIGQSFLSSYEEGKLEAEKLVRATDSLRRTTHIYRMGHLAAHSLSGVFQRSLSANRIYQTLHSYILTGVAPASPDNSVAFSHVDIVAEALLAFSEADDIPAGTFHLETPYEIDVATLVEWMNGFGYPVKLIASEEYAARLRELNATGTDRSLHAAAYWANRRSRNVRYDSSYSQALMIEQGICFPKPTEEWFRRFLTHIVKAGYFPEPSRRGSVVTAQRADKERALWS